MSSSSYEEKTRWEVLCQNLEDEFNLSELKSISESIGLNTNGLDKEGICRNLAADYEFYRRIKTRECTNPENFEGDDFDTLPDSSVVEYVDEEGTKFCFTPDELLKMYDPSDPRDRVVVNPYNRKILPKEVFQRAEEISMIIDPRRDVHKKEVQISYSLDPVSLELKNILDNMENIPRARLEEMSVREGLELIDWIRDNVPLDSAGTPPFSEETRTSLRFDFNRNIKLGLLNLFKILPGLNGEYLNLFFSRVRNERPVSDYLSGRILTTLFILDMKLGVSFKDNLTRYLHNRRTMLREIANNLRERYSERSFRFIGGESIIKEVYLIYYKNTFLELEEMLDRYIDPDIDRYLGRDSYFIKNYTLFTDASRLYNLPRVGRLLTDLSFFNERSDGYSVGSLMRKFKIYIGDIGFIPQYPLTRDLPFNIIDFATTMNRTRITETIRMIQLFLKLEGVVDPNGEGFPPNLTSIDSVMLFLEDLMEREDNPEIYGESESMIEALERYGISYELPLEDEEEPVVRQPLRRTLFQDSEGEDVDDSEDELNGGYWEEDSSDEDRFANEEVD